MDKAQKQAFVKDLNASLSEAESVVVSHYRGLTVAQMTNYRRQMRELGGSVKVAKNRLAKIAFKGTNFEGLEELMTGPTIIASSTDAVSAAKVTHDFAKEHENLVILGGTVGTETLDVAGVKALASMPSLDELRAKLIGLFAAPATQLATVTQAPASGIARQIAQKPE
jgi:large subunit ribosomal protein L10